MSLLNIFLLIFAVRLASVFIVQTYYVPDEYWQSLEVAHKLTFGYGYLTWEWIQGIRSYIYPGVIAAVYKILAFLNLDTAELLIILPRILQATLSAYSDYRFFVWTGKRKWALFLILVSWFWFYTGSRTLTNTMETSLTTIALSYFPWHGESTAYLWLAALCCFLRPTAAVIWLPLCIYHLRKSKESMVRLVVSRFMVIGFSVAALCIAIDSYFYGKLIVTPYEFLKYNVFHNIGSFYGSHSWYWYFTTGLPTVLGITTLPFIFGVMDTIRNSNKNPVRKQLLITIGISLLILSFIEHKEFRFVTSLLPLCLYITADALVRWSYHASRLLLWLTAITILVGNVLPAWYLSTTHQKGPIELMPKLEEISRNYRDENDRRASILFLMPCHSTPYYSHIHQNVTLRFLTCEPNLQNKSNYKDEADEFYKSPVHWLRSHIPSYPRSAMPTHVVFFEPLGPIIREFLSNYEILHQINSADIKNVQDTTKFINELSRRLKEKKRLNDDSPIPDVKIITDTNILVYQRLRDRNAFNQNDKDFDAKPSNERKIAEDEANDERNFFN